MWLWARGGQQGICKGKWDKKNVKWVLDLKTREMDVAGRRGNTMASTEPFFCSARVKYLVLPDVRSNSSQSNQNCKIFFVIQTETADETSGPTWYKRQSRPDSVILPKLTWRSSLSSKFRDQQLAHEAQWGRFEGGENWWDCHWLSCWVWEY